VLSPEPHPPGEVTFSYVDETLPVGERQRILSEASPAIVHPPRLRSASEDYGFTCSCERCAEALATPGGGEWDAGTLEAGPVHTAWQLAGARVPELATGQAVVRAVWEALAAQEAGGPEEDSGSEDEWEGGVAPEGVVAGVRRHLEARAQALGAAAAGSRPPAC
jgi:hypothetical protein